MAELKLRKQRKREVYNLKPGWFVRWGVSVVFIILLVLLLLAKIVRYPDIVAGETIITSTDPPATISVQNNLIIDKLYVEEGDTVKANQILVLFKNSAKTDDIFFVDSVIKKINTDDIDSEHLFNILWKKRYELGDLQPAFIELTTTLGNLYLLESSSVSKKKKKFMQEQLGLLKAVDTLYNVVSKLKSEEREIIHSRFIQDSSIRNYKYISKSEYDQSRISFLHSLQDEYNHNLTVKAAQVKLKELETNDNIFEAEESDKLTQSKLNFINTIRQFSLAMKKWEENFLIISPIDGIVRPNTILREKKLIAAGDIVLSVISLNKFYEAHLKIPFNGAGKISIGQKVKIKLADYPYKEYGCLLGKIEKLSQVANTDHYVALVKLDNNGLISNFGKPLQFKQNMIGVGEVITKDKSVLGRIFENITYVFNN